MNNIPENREKVVHKTEGKHCLCIIRGSGGDQIVGDIYWDILYRTTLQHE